MPEIIINGPEGRIEARYMQQSSPSAPIAIMLHPHPEHGGTMNNKVVYAMYRSFLERGFSVIRFNFRGVGRSEGVFDQGEGELSDAATVLDWLQQQNPSPQAYWVAGFSFGAWIGMQLLMRRPELNGFISVSPPANMYDFNFLAPCPVSGLIVQGDKDDIVPKESVDGLVDKLSTQRGITIDYNVIKGADHFFTNQTSELMNTVDNYIRKSTSHLEIAV
ncbi:MAG: alpha/beta hydrolase [Alphaproteobacteria bacterium]